MVRFYTLLAAMGSLVLSAPLAAQEPTATVRVSVWRDSLPQPMVVVRSGETATRTDSTGTAILRLLAGEHWIIAARLGFTPESALVRLRAAMDTSVVIELHSAAELASMIVSATRSERRIEDDPLRVEVLGREEVEEKLLMTPGDITMMLNESSGLRVQTTSPSLGGANVRVQGLRGRYTQILSDGLPLYGGQTGGLGLLQIPPMDLGGVEIIKGVASALYGGSALGGVINLISRRPGVEPERDLLANQTTLGGTDLVGFASGKASAAWGYTLLAGAHRQSRVDRDDDGWIDLPGYERAVLRPRAFWSHPTGHSLMVTAGTTLERRQGGTLEGHTLPDGSFHPERLRTRRFDAGGVGRWLVGDAILSTRGSATIQQHRHTFGAVLERDRHDTWFGETALTVARGAGVWVVGAALQGERYRSDDVPAFDFTFTTPGVFAQGTFDVGTRLAVTASARWDRHSEYGARLAPRVSSLLRLSPRWSVRASAGGGYFAPTPFTEETEVIGLTPLVPVGGRRAEKARSLSMDVGGALGPFEVNGTVFQSVISHPIRLVSGGGGRAALIGLQADTRTSGGELLSRWNPEPVHVTASYTYVWSSEMDLEVVGDRRELPLTPRHQAGIVGAWEQKDRARVGVEVYYTGCQTLDDDPYRNVSKPYVHVGALVERRFGWARVFVNAENLLDFRQTDYDRLVRPSPGIGGRWTTDVWGPLEGRVANVGVRFDWR